MDTIDVYTLRQRVSELSQSDNSYNFINSPHESSSGLVAGIKSRELSVDLFVPLCECYTWKMQLYIAIAIPILFVTAWLYTAQVTRASFSHLRRKRICLLIAHPDDEAMFFAPTLLALTAKELENHVKILCLSTGSYSLCLENSPEMLIKLGNADKLGNIRKKELLDSGRILGLRSPDDVFILDSPSFPDSMTTSWDSKAVATVLASAFSSQECEIHSSKGESLKGAPIATIDVLLTFDSQGVSEHPNHISLYHGAREWLSSLMEGKSGWKCPVELYTLNSTSLWRKYSSVLDAPITMLLGALRAAAEKGKEKIKVKAPQRLLFVNDVWQLKSAQSAMVKGHKSQMRWFRWGWIALGRYMIVNDLKREKFS